MTESTSASASASASAEAGGGDHAGAGESAGHPRAGAGESAGHPRAGAGAGDRDGDTGRAPRTARAARWVDDRLGLSRFTQGVLDKVFPDHWSFMIGEIALYCFAILVLTGSYLTFFYSPSQRPVVYTGSYAPLHGATMSDAYRSVLDISFKVRAGLVMRQIHHWAALVFLAAIVVHMARVFFTGGFRRPRELNWIVGVTLLLLAMANGFTGYSLPDDLLSGTGLRIMFSIILSIPLIGPWLAYLIFGGGYPGTNIIERLFIIHVLFIPVLIGGLLGAHLAILWHQKHTDFPGPGKTEDTIHGSRLWPQYMAKSVGLFCFVAAVLAALGGLAQINPIWIYGPYNPAAVSSGSQPDWYIGWLDGALRVMPNFEIRLWHHTIANPFFPGVLMPGITFGLLYAWPFIEPWFTKDRRAHNLLDRPRDRPVRTALGAATLSFYTVLFLAAGTDVLATTFRLSFEVVLRIFQVSCIVVPLAVGSVTWLLCKELARQRVHPIARPVGAVLVRTSHGGYDVALPTGNGGGDGVGDEGDRGPGGGEGYGPGHGPETPEPAGQPGGGAAPSGPPAGPGPNGP